MAAICYPVKKKKKKGSCCKYQSFLPRLTRVTVSAIWDILNLAIPVDVLQLRCDLYTLRDMLKSFSKCAVPCFHAICATLHWKVYCHHLLGWYLQVKAPPGFFCFFFRTVSIPIATIRHDAWYFDVTVSLWHEMFPGLYYNWDL